MRKNVKIEAYLIAVCLLMTGLGLFLKHEQPAEAATPAAEQMAIDATDPDIVFNNGETRVSWIEGGGFFYLIDNCAIPSKPTASLRRRPIEAPAVTVMQTITNPGLCDTYRSAAADESGIYYYNRSVERIEHIPTDSPQSVPQVLANIGEWSSLGSGKGISRLMLTGSNIFWIDKQVNGEQAPATIRFWRLAKDGSDNGVPEMIHSYETMDGNGFSDGGSAINGLNIIWTDRGGVYRLFLSCLIFPCDPYSVSTIKSQFIDDGRVSLGDTGELFWWDQEANPTPVNKITCSLFGCGTAAAFTGATGARVYNVNGSAADYYWHEQIAPVGIRLRRKAKSGGSTVTLDETIGLQATYIDGDYVYYSPDFNLIGRLAHDAEAITREFSIEGWEVTQGIQNLNNDVPLVAGKTTYVRVYPKLENGDNVNSLTAALHGERDGSALPESPLYPINGNLTISPTVSIAGRANLDNGWLFRLPETWVSGDDLLIPQFDTAIQLTAVIDPNGVYAGTDSSANNSVTGTFDFTAKAPTCMTMRPVWTHAQTQNLRNYQVAQTVRITEAILPTANLIPKISDERFEEIDWCWKGPVYGPFCNDPYELSDDDTGLLVKMGWTDYWADDPTICTVNNARTLLGGIVHPSATWDWGGLARLGGDQFLTKVRPPSDGAFDGFNGFSSLMAHEIGHNYGRRHVQCGNEMGPDNGYPYATNTLDDGAFSNPSTHFGFNILRQQPIAPNGSGNRGDVLSYCRQGISDYTWMGIFNATSDPIFKPFRGAEMAGDFLLLGGYLNVTQNTGELDYGWTYPVESASAGLRQSWGETLAADWNQRAPNATYHVRLIGKNDQILGDHTIELSGVEDDEDEQVHPFQFSVMAPAEPVVLVQLMADDFVLDAFSVGEKSPTVSVLKPAGGETVNDGLMIEWEAADPDKDDLQYTIQYSYDDGEHWTPLVVNFPGSGVGPTHAISVTIGSEPGSAGQVARVRVIASDGVNTAIDTSNPFSVTQRPPQVVITNLADDQIFDPSEPIRLDGFVYDPEDLLLQKQNLIWNTGQFSVTGQVNDLIGLSPGRHTIGLTGIDSDGLTTQFSRTIEIAPFHVPRSVGQLTLDGSCDDAGYQESTHLTLSPNDDGSRPVSWLTHSNSSLWGCTAGIAEDNDQTQIYLDFNPMPQSGIGPTSLVVTVKQDGTYTLEKGNGAGEWVKADTGDLSVRVKQTNGVWSAEVKIARAVFGDWQRRVQLYMAHGTAGETPPVKWPLGGDGSNPQTWGATNLGLVSQLSAISPSSTAVGSADLEISVMGEGFGIDNVVLFNGQPLDTGLIDGETISATIPADFIQTSGSFSITVGIAGADGLQTAHQLLRVKNPAPTLASLSPDFADEGASGLIVTLKGDGFTADSQVSLGGDRMIPTVVNAGELTLTLTADQLAFGRVVEVAVINPDPGGGVSTTRRFDVVSPFDPGGQGKSAVYLPFVVR